MLPSRRAVGRTCVIHGFMAWRRATRVWDAFKKLSCISQNTLQGRPKSLERFDRARALRAHAHVYKYTHAHWSTTTGPYHYGSAQDTIYPTGSGVYCCCPHAANS